MDDDTTGFRRNEPGMNTGDARENDPGSPGFTDRDRLFRSQFQHANRDRHGDEHVQGDGAMADAPASDAAQRLRDPAEQGRMEGLPPAGTTPSHDRASFTDPLPENTDPTEPEGPENRF